jgi:hypothetical protein
MMLLFHFFWFSVLPISSISTDFIPPGSQFISIFIDRINVFDRSRKVWNHKKVSETCDMTCPRLSSFMIVGEQKKILNDLFGWSLPLRMLVI